MTTSKPEGPLVCGHAIKIGHGASVFPALRRYAGKTVSLKIYGSGQFAVGVCKGFLRGFGGG